MVKHLRRSTCNLLIALICGLLASGVAIPAHADDGDVENVTFSEDLVVAAGDVLEGDVQVIRGDLVVEKGARIEGDALVVSGDCEVSGDIDGNVAVVFGSIEVSGAVDGDVLVVGGEAAITGEVDGNVVASGKVKLGPNAIVTGDVSTAGELDREDGAIILESDLGVSEPGSIDVDVPFADDRPSDASLATAGLLSVLLPALFAGLVAAVARGTVRHATDVLRRRGVAAVILGVFVWAALPFVMVILLPLSPLVFGLALVVAAVGFVGIGARVGGLLAQGSGAAVRSALGALVLGVPIALGLIAGPWLGGTAGQIVFVAALLLWFGLAALSLGVGLLTALEAGRRGDKAGPIGDDGERAPDGEVGPAAAPDSGAVEGTSAAVGAGPNAGERGAETGDESPRAEPPTASTDMPTQPMSTVALAGAATAGELDDEAPESTDTLVGADTEPTGDESDESAAPTGTDSAEATAVDEAVDDGPPTGPSVVGAGAPIGALTGVQPLYAYILGQAGYDTVGAIADASAADLAALTDQPGVTPVDEPTAADWVEEARKLIGR